MRMQAVMKNLRPILESWCTCDCHRLILWHVLFLMSQRRQSMYKSHLAISDTDPEFDANFSVESLRHSARGTAGIPSALHGAPQTADRGMYNSRCCDLKQRRGACTCVVASDSACCLTRTRQILFTCTQESRVTLDRLRRMEGFESQDFDPAVDNAILSLMLLTTPTFDLVLTPFDPT